MRKLIVVLMVLILVASVMAVLATPGESPVEVAPSQLLADCVGGIPMQVWYAEGQSVSGIYRSWGHEITQPTVDSSEYEIRFYNQYMDMISEHASYQYCNQYDPYTGQPGCVLYVYGWDGEIKSHHPGIHVCDLSGR